METTSLPWPTWIRMAWIAALATLVVAGAGAQGVSGGEKRNPLAKANAMDPLLGVFKSKDLTVTISAAGAGKYKGTLVLEGKSYPFTAEKDGPGISGTFTSDGDKFSFLAKLEGELLQLKSEDTVYLLERESPSRPANPLSRGNKPAPTTEKPDAAAPNAPGNVDPAWKILRHPIGLSVRYPKDWTLKELDSGYQLIPPGAAADSEVYILGAIPANGVAIATDPKVTTAAAAVMSQLAPALQRVGEVENLKAGDVPAIALTWEGGPNARARMYVIILKDHALGLTAIGTKEKIGARDGILRKIFTSFAQSEGQRDPQLVGVWNKTGTTSLDARDAGGRLQASSAGEHRRALALRADGTCLSREVDRTIAIGQGVAIDTGDEVKTKNGTWFAGDGKIVLMWEKDAEEYEYRLVGQPGGRQLVFVLDKGRGLVWEPAR